jgi:hypothetical protein
MNPNTKQWDADKINLLFSKKEANKILGVPLLHTGKEDKLIWNEENDGIYSVRSGYRKLMKDRKRFEWAERDIWLE